ncbi:murein biosynthesis integral membrane protein MurJ [Mesoterricola sediminis]|uniref:Probable lipid II flippase MurJ n=1 Tax=Mesoterricola sediminis TaxID=2927980 RepID=A0AA48HC99_9BACT|nr:murein biosynthesis integral membrane protein MurJ [Mesoterricola sediminis]BDU75648.1 putative lipid II flippase MurJ [Mesoterricola sediminis]
MTLLSRVSGMLQSRVVAHYLGAGPAADAFFVAYRIPNLLRRFTAEGTMTSAFLPTLNEVETGEGDAAARQLTARFLGTLGLGLALLSLIAIPAMGVLTGLQMLGRLAPAGAGLGEQLRALGWILAHPRLAPPAWTLTTVLAQIMFPYLTLVSLTAGLAAVLNLRGRFALPASVSTFWNLTFILVTWAGLEAGPRGWRVPEAAALVMAGAALAGGLVQLAVLWPGFRALGYGVRPGLHLKDPGVRRALRRMAPGLLGTGIAPINALISTALASQLAVGAQTVLFNANMMGEMVLGVFAASIATVSLPVMSRLVEAGDLQGLRRALAEALRGTAVLAIPGSVGMAVLAQPIIALIFQTGRFNAQAVAWTAATLGFQAVGLLFIATGRITAQCLYALKDYRRPAYAALLSMVVNIALSLALMGPLGTGGMALANGLASIAGLVYMTAGLRPRLPALPWREVGGGWVSMGAASAVMGLLAWVGAGQLGLSGPYRGLAGTSLRLFPLIAACALVYGALLLLFRVPEGTALLSRIRRRLGR